MDFIPNHTGKKNEWFMKSQKKEGIYKDFYVWESCDPNSGSYPNNWVNIEFLCSFPLVTNNFLKQGWKNQ